MGTTFADSYSLLHFAVGVVAYFVGIRWWVFLLLHILFEYVENTSQGVEFIDRNLSWFWPGGKEQPDSLINSVGDTVFAMLGWMIAAFIHKRYPAKYF